MRVKFTVRFHVVSLGRKSEVGGMDDEEGGVDEDGNVGDASVIVSTAAEVCGSCKSTTPSKLYTGQKRKASRCIADIAAKTKSISSRIRPLKFAAFLTPRKADKTQHGIKCHDKGVQVNKLSFLRGVVRRSK
jgi:hypothetical protein